MDHRTGPGLRRTLSAVGSPITGKLDVFVQLRHKTDRKPRCIRVTEDSCGILCSNEPRSFDDFTEIYASPPSKFGFRRIFSADNDIDGLYKQAVRPAVQRFIQGQHGCVFLYGQSGTGKVFTVEGSQAAIGQKGIVQKSLEDIFFYIQQVSSQQKQFSIRVSAFEVFNENIIDLMKPRNANLRIIDHQHTVEIVDLSSKTLSTPDEITEIFKSMNAIRSIARMTEKSAEGHTLLTISLEELSSDSSAVFDSKHGQNHNRQTKSRPPKPERGRLVSKFTYIILAGSEKAREIGHLGHRSDEAAKIAKTFNALITVIGYHARGESQIPVRYSKLTHILKDCFVNQGHIVFIGTVSSSMDDYLETISTLKFSTRIQESAKEAGKLSDEYGLSMLSSQGKSSTAFRDHDISIHSQVETSYMANRTVSSALDRDTKVKDERPKISTNGYSSLKDFSYDKSETELMKSRVLDNVVQLQNLHEESSDLRQKLIQAQNRIRVLEAESGQMKEALHMSGAQNYQDREIADAMQATINQQQDIVRILEKEKSDLLSENNDLQRAILTHQREREELILQNQKLRVEQDRFGTQLADLQKEISMARSTNQEIYSTRGALSESRQEVEKLGKTLREHEGTIDHLKRQTSHFSSNLEETKSELQKKNMEISRLESMLKSAKENNSVELEEMSKTKSQRDQFRKQLMEFQSAAEENYRKFEEQQMEAQRFRQELSACRESRENLRKEIGEKSAKMIALEDEIVALQRELKQSRSTSTNLETEIPRVRKEYESDLQKYRTRIRELESKIQEIALSNDEENVELTTKIEVMTNERIHLVKQLQQAQNEIEKRESVFLELSAASSKLVQERDGFLDLERESQSLSEAYSSAQQAHEDLAKIFNSIKTEIRQHQSEKERLVSVIKEKKSHLQMVHQEIFRIRDLIDSSKTTLSSERLSYTEAYRENAYTEDLISSFERLRDDYDKLHRRLVEREGDERGLRIEIEKLMEILSEKDRTLVSFTKEKEEMYQSMTIKTQELTSELEKYRIEINKQNKTLNDHRSDIEKLKTLNAEYARQLETYKIQMDKNRDHLQQMELEYQDVLKSKSQLEDDRESKLSDLNQLQRVISEKNSIIQQYEWQSKQYESQIEATRRELVVKNDEMDSFRSRFVSLQKQLQETKISSEETIQMLQSQIENYIEEVGLKNTEIIRSQTIREQLNEEIDRLRKILNEKDTNITQYQALSQEKHDKMTELEGRIENLQRSLKAGKAEHSRTQTLLSQTQAILEEEKAASSTLKIELDALQNRLNETQSISKEKDKLAAENKSLRTDIQRLIDEKTKISTVVTNQKQVTEKQTRDIMSIRASMDEMSAELIELRSWRNQTENLLADRSANILRLEQEIEQMSNLLQTRDSDISSLEQQNSQLDMKLAQSAAQFDNLNKRHAELQKMFDETRSKCEIISRDIEIYKKQFDESKKTLLAKEIDISSTREVLAATKKEVSLLQTENTSLKNLDKQQQIELDRLKSATQNFEQIRKANEQLRNDLSASKLERQELIMQAAKYQENAEAIHQQLSNLRDEVQMAEKGRSEYVLQVKKAHELDLGLLKKSISDKDAAIEQLQSRIQSDEKTVAALREQIRVLQDQLSDRLELVQRVTSLTGSLEEIREERSELQRNLDLEYKKNTELLEHLESLSKSTQTLESAVEGIRSETTALKDERETLRAIINEKEAALRDAEQKFAESTADLGKTMALFDEQNVEVENIRRAYMQNQQECEKIIEQYNALLEENEELRAHIDNMTSGLSEHNMMLRERDEEISRMEGEFSKLVDAIRTKDEQITLHVQQTNGFREQISSGLERIRLLETELNRTLEEKESMKLELLGKTLEVNQKNADIDNLQIQAEDIHNRNLRLSRDAKSFQEFLDRSRVEAEQSATEIQELRNAFKRLEESYLSCQKELLLSKNKILELGQSRSTLEDENRRLQRTLDSISGENTVDQKIKNNVINICLKALKETLRNKDGELALAKKAEESFAINVRELEANLSHKLKEVQSQSIVVHQEMKDMETKLEEKDAELNIQINFVKSLQTTLQKLESELQLKNEEIVQHKRLISDIQSHLSSASSNNDEISRENNWMKAELSKLNSELPKLRGEIRVLTQSKQGLESDIEMLKVNLGAANKGKEEYSQEVRKLRGEQQANRLLIEEKSTELEIMRGDYQQMRISLDEMRKRCAEAEIETKEAKRQIQDMERTLQQSESTTHEIRKAKTAIETQLSRCQTQRASLETEYQVLRAEHETVTKELLRMREFALGQEKELEEMRQELERLQMRLVDAEMELNSTRGQTEIVNSELVKTIRRFEGGGG